MLRYENKVQETIRYKNHLSSAELLTEQRLASVLWVPVTVKPFKKGLAYD